MPHRPTQRCRLQTGFSLIELLVAVLVIVLLTTVVSLNVGTGDAEINLENEVRDVASTMAFVQSEAELTGIDHGLLLAWVEEGGESGYRANWRRRYDQGWAAPKGTGPTLDELVLAEAMELRLQLDGQPDVALQLDQDIVNPPPQIQFFAGGEVSPGALEWLDPRTGALLWRLEWDLFGRMTSMPRGEVDDSE